MKYCLSLLFIYAIVFSCSSTKKIVAPEQDYFKVGISQNGEVVNPRDGEIIQLKKAPFKYLLSLHNIEGVYISNSWDRSYYDAEEDENMCACDETQPVEIMLQCYFSPFKAGAEDKFNTQKDIFVGGRDYHAYWYYVDETEPHRLDKDVEVTDNGVEASITVENIFDLMEKDNGAEDFTYPIEEINKDLFIVVAHCEKGEEGLIEKKRLKFKIEFE